MRIAHYQLDDGVLGLWSPGEKEFGDRGGRHLHFAFSVNHGELVTVRDRLRALGIKHRGPVRHEGGDQSLYFEDPEGNVVEAWTSSRTATAPPRASPPSGNRRVPARIPG